MDDIDYEALAKAYREATGHPDGPRHPAFRAVVAAYREQMRARGVVEVLDPAVFPDAWLPHTNALLESLKGQGLVLVPVEEVERMRAVADAAKDWIVSEDSGGLMRMIEAARLYAAKETQP